MSRIRLIVAASGLAFAPMLLSACSGSVSAIPAPVPTAAATTSVNVEPSVGPSNSPSPEPSPAGSPTTRAVTGSVEVGKGGYFLFPAPPSMTQGGSTPDDWRWSLTYDEAMLIAANEIKGGPESAADVAFGTAGSGSVWQARKKAGETVMRYSYIDPAEPLVTVDGEYTVTVTP